MVLRRGRLRHHPVAGPDVGPRAGQQRGEHHAERVPRGLHHVVDVGLRGRGQPVDLGLRVGDAGGGAERMMGMGLVLKQERHVVVEKAHPVAVGRQREAEPVAAYEGAQVLVVLAHVVQDALMAQGAVA